MKSISWIFMILIHAAPSYGNSTSTSSRIRRSPSDKLTTLIANFQSLSRITNGISLESRLIDGSTSPEDAVVELLRLENLKFDDVMKLDKNSIDNAFKELDKLPKANIEQTTAQDRLIYLDYVRLNSGFMSDFKAFPGKNDYKTALNKVVKLGQMQLSSFDELKLKATALQTTLLRFKGYPEDVTEHVEEIRGFLSGDFLSTKAIETSVKVLNPLYTPLKEAKSIEQFGGFLGILYDEKNLRDNLQGISYGTTIDTISTDLSKIQSAQSAFQSSKSIFDTLGALIASRSTIGLDIQKLAKDPENPWFLARSGTESSGKLKNAFSQFNGLATKLKSIEQIWKPISGEPSLQKVVSAHSGVLELQGNLQQIGSTINALKKCDTDTTFFTADISKVDNIKKDIDKLNHLILRISSLEYASVLQDLSSLKAILNTKDTVDKVVAQRIVSDVKSNPTFNPVLDALNRIGPDIDALKLLKSDVVSTASRISTGFNVVGSYHDLVNKAQYVETFFKCLKTDVGDASSNVKKALEALRKTQLDATTTSDAQKVIQKILASQKDLTSAKEAAKEVKSTGIWEAKALKASFPKSLEVSNKLKLGFQGLEMIQKVHSEKDNLKTLLEDSQLQVFVKGLPEVYNGIDQFLSEIGTLDVARLRRNTKDFKSQSQFFVAASKIPSFKFDRKTVEQNLQKFGDFSKELDILTTLDMDFQKYKFQESGNSLAEVDSFLMSFAKASVSGSSSSPSGSGGNGVSNIGSGFQSTTEALKTPGGSLFGFFLWGMPDWKCILILCGVVAVVTIIGVCACRHCKKKEKKEKKKEIVSPIVSPIPSTPPPPVVIVVENPQPQNQNARDVEAPDVQNNPDPAPDPPPGNDPAAASDSASSVQRIVNADPEDVDELEQDPNAQIVAEEKPLVPSSNKRLDTTINEIQEAPANDTITFREFPDGSIEVDRTLLDGEDGLFMVNELKTEIDNARIHRDKETPLEFLVNLRKALDREAVDGKKKRESYPELRNVKYKYNLDTQTMVRGHDVSGYNNVYIDDKQHIVGTGPCENEDMLDRNGNIMSGQKMAENREKHFDVIHEHKVQLIIQPSEEFNEFNLRELGSYFPDNFEGRQTHGKWTVKLQTRVRMAHFDFYTVIYSKGEKDENDKTIFYKVRVLKYHGLNRKFMQNEVPLTAEPMLAIVDFMNKYKGPIVLFCSDGLLRSGTIMAIAYGLHICIQQKTTLSDILNHVNRARFGCIKSEKQIAYIAYCIARGLMSYYDKTHHENCDSIEYIYRQVVLGWYEMGTIPQDLKLKCLKKDVAEMKAFCLAKAKGITTNAKAVFVFNPKGDFRDKNSNSKNPIPSKPTKNSKSTKKVKQVKKDSRSKTKSSVGTFKSKTSTTRSSKSKPSKMPKYKLRK